jgi:putative ABC transport system permease protein
MIPEWKQEIYRHLANLRLAPTREIEIVEELAEHLEDYYQELLTAGATPAEARQQTLAELRESKLLMRELRRLERQTRQESIIFGTHRRGNMIADFWQDIRYGTRMLRKNPGFTVVALLSLALGIGANTAIFQLLDAVRLRTLPVKAPQELAQVYITDTSGMRGNKPTSYPAVTNPIWEQIRQRQQSFSRICAWGTDTFNLSEGGEVREARALWVSGEFFNVLGVQARLGRLFTAEDDQRSRTSAQVVISYPFWQREFGGDANIIGQKITLAKQSFEIIGVTPANFFGLEVGKSFDVALPICAEAITAGQNHRLDSGTNWWLMVTGRLKPGTTLEQATAELQGISPSLFEQTLPAKYPPVSVPKYLDMKLAAESAAGGYSVLRNDYESSLWILLAIAGLVLVIACANLANLLLARASAREREMAVRQALGASRTRLIRQLLAESLLLAFAGAILGAGLAQSLSRFLVAFLNTGGNNVFLDMPMDWRVLGFAALLGVLTCVLFGLMPAIRATRIEPATVMKASGRGLTAGRKRFSLRRTLVVIQVALSLVLLTGALLFTRSLNKLMTVDSGFRQEGILISQVNFADLNLPSERRLSFKQEVIDRLKTIPGVQSITDTAIVPLSGDGAGNNAVWMDGTDEQNKLIANRNWIGPDYFKTLGTPLLAGREFNKHDTTTAPKVAIVNQSFVRQLLNGANPIGQRFWLEATAANPARLYEIVGEVKDTKYRKLREESGPIIFIAIAQEQNFSTEGQFLIRFDRPQSEITVAVKQILDEINPAIKTRIQGFQTMVEDSILRERLLATLSGFFGVLALLLASIGLYGILSYGVVSRTQEIGIRMALGATRSGVMWMILREALLLIITGLVIGFPAVLAATRMIAALLFNLPPTDPFSLFAATLLLLTVGVLAGYLPAMRATRIDPMAALRSE